MYNESVGLVAFGVGELEVSTAWTPLGAFARIATKGITFLSTELTYYDSGSHWIRKLDTKDASRDTCYNSPLNIWIARWSHSPQL
jgi:hypothetical protein